MISPDEYRRNRIRVFATNGQLIEEYRGKIYLYFDKDDQDVVHFITEDGKHHRVRPGVNTVVIDEE